MPRKIFIGNLALALTFLVIVLLSFNGNIEFGAEPGDIAFIAL